MSEDGLAHRSASVKFTRPIVVVEPVTQFFSKWRKAA